MRNVPVSHSVIEQNLFIKSHEVFVQSYARNKKHTIILVHGIAVSQAYFEPLITRLQADYNVIALNLPGWRNTQKPAKALSISELALILESFIATQKITNPILIGQSMGCQIVARLIQKSPAQDQKSILIGPTVNKYERTPWLQLIRLLQDCFREPFSLNVMLLRDYFVFGPLRYIKTQHYMMEDVIEESLKRTPSPLLIVRGSEDGIAPERWVKYLQKINPAIEVRNIAGAPHNAHYTHPEETARVIREFINT